MIEHSYFNTFLCFVRNIVMAYIVYAVCRMVFLFENYATFGDALSELDVTKVLTGCWYFDSSAIAYTMALYVLMMLVPCHLKENHSWHLVTKWVYLIIMMVAVIANFCDAVYYPYTGRRSTLSVFTEFGNDSNIAGIIGIEIVNHWYLVLLAAGLFYAMYKLYAMPVTSSKSFENINVSGHLRWEQIKRDKFISYYITGIVILALSAWITIIGMRGGATAATRPITLSNANQYVNHPSQAALLLNTPFAMIRSSNHNGFVDPKYYDEDTLDRLYTPIVTPKDTAAFRPKNVVVFIIESMAREYIGAFNDSLEGGNYKGYTPFLDSLIKESLTFDYSFCNGRKSIDAMPSILSSIPMFVEPYFVSSTSLNEVGGLAECLRRKGYNTSFVHPADNGSMGFEAFARATQFERYLGRDEYSNSGDPEFDGTRDYDGRWGIWDQPFMRFWQKDINRTPEPFMSTIFTATSHHPFHIPDEYKERFPEEELEIHKCIRYVDMALEEFFSNAKQQPWYENTLFVICGDHTNQTNHAEYQTDLGVYSSPVIFFDPSGEMPRGRRHAIAQQIDVMPTILNWLHYDEPYLAYGIDVINTPDEETWAVNYNNGIYQMVKNGWMLQFDGERSTALYNIKNDWMLHDNKLNSPTALTDSIRQDYEQWYKALIQSYMSRMVENRLIARKGSTTREKVTNSTNWANDSLWYQPSTNRDPGKVDVLYFVSTEVLSTKDSTGQVAWQSQLIPEDLNAMIHEVEWVEKNMFKGEDFNVWAPFYHQYTFDAIWQLDSLTMVEVTKDAISDACDAFDYYMEHANDGRPFILAGFSQGAVMAVNVLKHMTDEQYQRMIACYSLGCQVTAEDLRNPHIKAATGETDRGVVISFNSVQNTDAIWRHIAGNPATCINPVNWRTDETPATFTFKSTTNEVHVDQNRNVLVVKSDDPEFYYKYYDKATFFLDAGVSRDNLHHWDLQFYKDMIHDNALKRAKM